MRARLQCAVLAAVLAAAPGARADDAGEAPGAPSVAAVEPSRRGDDLVVRPILLGGFGGASGVVSLGADLGLRVGPVTARFAWRGEFMESGDYLAFPSGRLGWLFAESRWISAHAGVGAGRLTRSFDDPSRPSASSTAVVGELGVLFAPRWALGPAFGIELEALAPVGATAPSGAALTAPVVTVMASVNVVVLFLGTVPGGAATLWR